MNKTDGKVILEHLILVTAKESRYLMKTAHRMMATGIDIAWVKSLEESDEHSEMLDAFVSRYGRLQDTLGDKLIPALLRVTLEKTGSQLDNILRAEKLGWIESAESWIEIRELRNRMVHEYMTTPEELLEALQLALRSVPVLIDAQKRMADVAAHMCTARN